MTFYKAWQPKETEQAVTMHRAGIDMDAIGEAVGFTGQQVREKLKRIGLAVERKTRTMKGVKIDCLKCLHPFLSWDKIRNRLCKICTKAEASGAEHRLGLCVSGNDGRGAE